MSGEQVPCQVCGQPAPRFGPYAKFCADHRPERTTANGQVETIVEQSELEEARDILRRLVMDGDRDLDGLRLEAARHLIGAAL